ncbi:MAG: transcription antitermination factor NusB [Burkholderiales bacterium]
MGTRRKARELALQMLFQADLGRQTPEHVRKTFWAERSQVDDEARDFTEKLFHVATERAEEIDALIGRHAEHWRMERMAAVDRNILRTGVAELLAMETPKPVVINEALEIARRFSAPESVHFINGVLDSIAREMKAAGAAEDAEGKRQKEKGKRKKKLPA